MKKYSIPIVAAAAALVVGAAIGWSAYRIRAQAISSNGVSNVSLPVRVNLPQYKYINPSLFSNSPKTDTPQFNALASEIAGYISSAENDGTATSVSVDFRDLNSSQWTGVNEDETYTPSSMLKVIAMMGALKLAEQDPSILDEKLLYTPTVTHQQYYEPDDSLTAGYYSVQDLIAYMIKYSDNDALDALLSDPQINAAFTQTYGLFRLPTATSTNPLDPTDFMSPVSYANIFRSLYNSTFFGWDLSEQVLELLTETTFTQGLVAGVPSDVPVAHKFGENTQLQADGTVVDRELHDCGIVYYPDHPYLICVMTRGQDFPALASVIAGVSKLVYQYVDSNEGQL